MDRMTEIFFDNVDSLIERKHLLWKDLEKTAGFSPGYGSRIRKGERPLKGSYRAGIAEALGVTVEYLSTPHSNDDVESAELTEFFATICERTRRNDVFWMVFDEDRLSEEGLEEGEPIFQDFIFLPEDLSPEELQRFCGSNPDPDEYVSIPTLGGRSLHFGREIDGYTYTKISQVHCEAFARIEDIGSRLYLYDVDYETNDAKKQISNVVEAYLTSGNEQYFLCSSAWAPLDLASLLKTLLQSAIDQATSSRLQEGAHKLIKKFNALKERNQ